MIELFRGLADAKADPLALLGKLVPMFPPDLRDYLAAVTDLAAGAPLFGLAVHPGSVPALRALSARSGVPEVGLAAIASQGVKLDLEGVEALGRAVEARGLVGGLIDALGHQTAAAVLGSYLVMLARELPADRVASIQGAFHVAAVG